MACLSGMPLIFSATMVHTNTTGPISSDGKIELKAFENKKGKITVFSDYYFNTGKQSYFIQPCGNSLFSNGVIRRIVGEKIHIIGELKNGQWDNCSSEMVQSRTGEYLIISTIELLNDPEYFISDGSGNAYDLRQNQIHYIPVKPENSSSGMYSGGEEKTTSIDLISYLDLRDQIKTLCMDKALHIKNRVKGSVGIRWKENNKIKSVIVSDETGAKILQSLKSALHGR